MAGKRRSSDEWDQLFDEFEAGDESGKAFCLRQGISTSNFHKRRSERVSASPSVFVAARRAAPSTCSVTLQVGEVAIHCDTQAPVTWLSDLVAALRQ